jgi:hypothetical protein
MAPTKAFVDRSSATARGADRRVSLCRRIREARKGNLNRLLRMGDADVTRRSSQAELEGECLLCDGTRSMADIIAFLQQEYPDAQSAVVEDVRVAVEQLVR